MDKKIVNIHSDFENIVQLIEEAQLRTFRRVNAELVMLYFNVGKIVSLKVENGFWGEHTVDELAEFIQTKIISLRGFNRRGLYRMKQFYETYTSEEFLSLVIKKAYSRNLAFFTSSKIVVMVSKRFL